MNTEEFTKTTVVTKIDDTPAPVEESGDYVVNQSKTILKIFAIFAIALALVFWIYAVNSSIVTQNVKITSEEISAIYNEAENVKELPVGYFIPEFTFDIKGRKTVLEDASYTADDFEIEILTVNTLDNGSFEVELSIEPNSSKIFLATKGTIKVKLEPKIEVLPNARP